MYQKISYLGYKSTMYLVSVLRRIDGGMRYRYSITSTRYRGICQLGLGGHLSIRFSQYTSNIQSNAYIETTIPKMVA